MQIRELTTKLGFDLDLTNLKRAEKAIASYKKVVASSVTKAVKRTPDNVKADRDARLVKSNLAFQAKARREMERDLYNRSKKTEQQRTSDLEKSNKQRIANTIRYEKAKQTSQKRLHAQEVRAYKENESWDKRKLANTARQKSANMQVLKGLERIGRTARNIGLGMTAFITYPMARMVKSSFQTAVNYERMAVAVGAFIGEDRAPAFMKDLNAFAMRTPLDVTEIAEASSMLLGIGVEEDKIINKMQMLGDLTRGNGEVFKRVVNQYSQAIAKGKPAWDEIKRFGEAGVPVLKALTELLGTDQAGIMEMSKKGMITAKNFDDALKLLQNTTFKDMMAKQMEEVNGQVSLLKSLVTEVGRIFVTDWFPIILPILKGINGILGAIAKMPKPLRMISSLIMVSIGLIGVVLTAYGTWKILITQITLAQMQLNAHMGVSAGLSGGLAGNFKKIGSVFTKVAPMLVGFGAKLINPFTKALFVITAIVGLLKWLDSRGSNKPSSSVGGLNSYQSNNTKREVNVNIDNKLQMPEGSTQAQTKYMERQMDRVVDRKFEGILSGMIINTSGAR